MEEKRNVTICFNSDEMYIVKHFQEKGKLSTEMKRILKDYVDNNRNNNDLEEILDARLAKILSIVMGNGVSMRGNYIPQEVFSQLNNLQNSNSSSLEQIEEPEEEIAESDTFNLPPDDMIGSLPFLHVNEDDE